MNGRVRDTLRVFLLMLTYAVLGMLWAAVAQQFYFAMAPRFGHLGATGLTIADRPCGSPQCDFSGFWPAGLLARAGHLATLYDPAAFLDYRHRLFSSSAQNVRWFYPPPAILPFIALSYLPFEPAFWTWSVFSLATGALLLRRAGLSLLVIAAALLSPAALWNLELGQFGALTGAILVAGLLLAGTKPRRAGVLMGLLVLKPPVGLLLPVAMAAAKHWRVIAAAAITAGVAIIATGIWLGPGVWRLYLGEGLAVSKTVLEAPPATALYIKFGVSVFWMLRGFGAGVGLSYAVQAASTLAGAGLTWAAWRRANSSRTDKMALTVCLSLLATPYGYTDDMVAWSIALAALAEARAWRIDLLDVLFWLWPMFCPIVFADTGWGLTPFIVAFATARIWYRAGRPRAYLPAGAAVLPRAL